ncbi:trans-aconitate 2-methyltransferase [uncultured Desulfovibrio sp.]|uniref:class I SAM-dependent methyltransferase n=1 Tax=uncultured Desulfovibrio sp. TaxID=167968 RepID=UPI0025E64503|nr:class I SAM-dependent methyltransferase [uncultured Desulfovibrio sp.]
MQWDSALYDTQHDFVAEYGKGLLECIAPDASQSILDLGCGTGTLTDQLAARAGSVVGIDASPEMIGRAKQRFPHLAFMVGDALSLPFERQFDIVFSNAVFHWIPDHDRLLKRIRRALKAQGRLICEFGARGNVATIEEAFSRACGEHGYAYTGRFTFPTAETFASLLVDNRFTCEQAVAYDRPTPLRGGEQGLRNWMRQFFAADLGTMPERRQEALLERVEELTRPRLWNGSVWMADYRRLRVVARS